MVGIVAAYRDLEKSHWRLVVPLPEALNTNSYKVWQFSPNEETIKVSVKANGLAVTDREGSWWPFYARAGSPAAIACPQPPCKHSNGRDEQGDRKRTSFNTSNETA